MARLIRHRKSQKPRKFQKPIIRKATGYTVSKINNKTGKEHPLFAGSTTKKKADTIFIKALNSPKNHEFIIEAKDVRYGYPASRE